jgi:Na+/H+ antiporter NhaC
MSRFSEEMKIIPRPAQIAAIIAALLVPFAVLVFVIVARLNPSHVGLSWVPFAAIAGLSVMLVVTVYILLVGYIVGDARRRGMRPVLWALLAIFIPNAIGIILYFILRDPLLKHCSKCGAAAQPSFTYCAVCGEALSKTCPSCHGPVQPGWSHCARCGASLPSA